MRPNLNMLTERRRRASRHRRPGSAGRGPSTETHTLPTAPEASIPAAQRFDADLRRGREAGGPDDQASYTCQCGFVFAADVSTTVACPNCGDSQAW